MILEGLYSNGIYPIEEIVPKGPEYRELGRKIDAEREYFESILSPADAERLDNCYDLITDRTVIDSRESFIYGFRLAALIMIDIFHAPEK